MNRSEAAQHYQEYVALMRQARAAAERYDIPRVLELATAAWGCIDGMLRHVRRDGSEKVPQLAAISLVLRFAPIVFEKDLLTRLEQFLKSNRRIAKEAGLAVSESVAEAHSLMWRAHALWDQMERHGAAEIQSLRNSFPGPSAEWLRLIEVWEAMAVVRRESANGIEYLTLATQMDRHATAKCPHCGQLVRRTKSGLLEQQRCARCRRKDHLVLFAESPFTTP